LWIALRKSKMEKDAEVGILALTAFARLLFAIATNS
jgi:hypothetical protein